ncbi:tripartite tricarboxylate transporter substrate-binding protein [Acrocarpospora macrocephala]|uniref:Tricarboxylate transporter n=1 Tax=Acrocarpospora macrocephala TaxID=150177 RepID=A0A5M3WXI2_9ACTN|nr:hypothetical protein [Acrocarpospora macrocephala]GES13096.1 hypothetical protein Amac_066930 [Acrocarpospora macrocephala]
MTRTDHHRQRLTTIRLGAAAVACALLAACGGTAATDGAQQGAEQQAPYYEGKKIKLLVPFAPGGGADTTARLLAPLLQKAIPGNPSIFIENRGGGGSITGTNHFMEREPHDGTTILVSSGSTHSAYVLQDPNVKFDFVDMKPIVGFPFGGALYVWASTGIKKPEDIAGKTAEPLRFAGENPSGGDLRRLLALDLLGVKYQAIFGYEGAGDSRIAFERGESNISTDSALPYLREIKPKVDSGEIVPIMSTGLVVNGKLERVPSLPDLMTPAELYEKITGKPAAGPEWEANNLLVASGDSLSKALWLHGDAPAAAVDAFNQGIEKMLTDPAMRKTLDEELQGNEPLRGAALQSAIDAMVKPSPEARKWLQDYLTRRWDYKFPS